MQRSACRRKKRREDMFAGRVCADQWHRTGESRAGEEFNPEEAEEEEEEEKEEGGA